MPVRSFGMVVLMLLGADVFLCYVTEFCGDIGITTH